MPTITMTSKGQITLPAATRAKLRLMAGSKFSVTDNPNGEIVLKVKDGDVRRLRGMLKQDGPPPSTDAVDAAIADAVLARFDRSAG